MIFHRTFFSHLSFSRTLNAGMNQHPESRALKWNMRTWRMAGDGAWKPIGGPTEWGGGEVRRGIRGTAKEI